MSSFTQMLDTRYMPDTDNHMVLNGFRYWIGNVNSGSYVDVPTGFRSDGASVPKIFQNIISPWGKHGQAAVLHDFLCTYRTVIVYGKAVSISRKQADDIFLEAMKVLDVPALRYNTMYIAVRGYAIVSLKF